MTAFSFKSRVFDCNYHGKQTKCFHLNKFVIRDVIIMKPRTQQGFVHKPMLPAVVFLALISVLCGWLPNIALVVESESKEKQN